MYARKKSGTLMGFITEISAQYNRNCIGLSPNGNRVIPKGKNSYGVYLLR